MKHFEPGEQCAVASCDRELIRENVRTDRILCRQHRLMASRYSLMDQELVDLFAREDGKCQRCHVEQAAFVLHDYNCCVYTKGYLKSCGECVEAAVCKKCLRVAQEQRKKLVRSEAPPKRRVNLKFSEDETCAVPNCDELLRFQNLKTDRKLCMKHRRTASIYSLTDEALVALFSKFEGKCHVCKTNNATQVDHDHSCCAYTKAYKSSCGKCVRGALCKSCNWGLGYLQNDPSVLEAAIGYLTKLDSGAKLQADSPSNEIPEKSTSEIS